MGNILITGANGQLGCCLRDLSHGDERNHYFYTDVDELDITSLDQVEDYVSKHDIEVIINAAGYTAVDRAEQDEERCFLINAQATRYLAQVTKRHEIFLVHISTDYVFEGNLDIPHKPDDPINPQSVYGKSKAAGEQARITFDARWGSNARALPRYKTINNPALYYETYFQGLKNFFINSKGMSEAEAFYNANIELTGNGKGLDEGTGFAGFHAEYGIPADPETAEHPERAGSLFQDREIHRYEFHACRLYRQHRPHLPLRRIREGRGPVSRCI